MKRILIILLPVLLLLVFTGSGTAASTLTLSNFQVTANGTTVSASVDATPDIVNVVLLQGASGYTKLAPDTTPVGGVASWTVTLPVGTYTIRTQGWNVPSGVKTGKSTPILSTTVTVTGAPPPPPVPPANTAAPVVTGTAQQGDTLTATNGSWSGTAPITYTDQWQDCTTSCSNISGATGSTYRLGAGDVGDTVDVVVTATNAAGSASQASAQTGVVQPPPPPTVPTGLTATPGNGTVTLTWNPSTDVGGPGLSGYDVYQDGTFIYSGGCSAGNVPPCTMTANVTNGVQHSYTVDAYDVNGLKSAQSAPVTSAGQAPSPTGNTVAAAPEGVPTPSGGWTVEYGDAFGSCLTTTTTNCSAGYPRSDNTWVPYVAGPWSKANSLGAFAANENNITTQGLDMHCAKTPDDGYNYSCGDLNTNNSAHAFTFQASGHHLTVEFVAKLPNNLNHMEDPAVWSSDPGNALEIDFPEWWGWPASSTTDNGWCGAQWTFPGIPFDGGGSTGQTVQTFCKTAGENFDPSTAFHTYTLDMNNGVMTGYVDGTQVSQRTFTGLEHINEDLILQNMLRKNSACNCDNGSFPAGGTDMIIRSIAMYEPASAGNAGTNGPIIAPGTSVGP